MPLALTVADNGLAGRALRQHRGGHVLHGTGPCLRLASILPSLIAVAGNAAVIPHRLALWLVLPCLRIRDNVKLEYWYNRMVGHERLGTALDKLLPEISTDNPRAVSVLRAMLRTIARTFFTAGTADELYVDMADLYEVGPHPFISGTGIDDIYDWVGLLHYADLIDAEGSLSIVAIRL